MRDGDALLPGQRASLAKEEVFEEMTKAEEMQINRITNQAVKVCKKKGKRYDTYFYKVVLGGNVKVARRCLEHMESEGQKDTMNWLLKLKKNKKMNRNLNSVGLCCLRTFMFFLFVVLSTIISPIFYMVHGLLTSVFTRKKRRFSSNPRLPLAFAAFSQKSEMIELFIEKGVQLTSTDRNGNNIFHYLADLSSESASRALEIFCMMIDIINDPEVTRFLVAKQRNTAGLTAMEYAAKYGAPQFLAEMLNHPNLVKVTDFAVGEEKVGFGDDSTHSMKANEWHDASTKLEYVDISDYESGVLSHQSAILNLLSDRHVIEMSEHDLKLFHKGAFVGRWIVLKTKQMLLGCFFLHTIDVLITAILLYLLLKGDMLQSVTVAKSSNAVLGVKLDEMQAIINDKSTIFKDEKYADVIERSKLDMKISYLNDTYDGERILEKAVLIHPELKQYFTHGTKNLSLELPSTVVNKIFDAALQTSELAYARENILFIKYMHEIVHAFAESLFEALPHLKGEKIDIASREFIEEEIRYFFDQLEITFENTTIRPGHWGYYKLSSAICIPKRIFSEDDVEIGKSIAPPSEVYHSSCNFKVLLNMAYKHCKNISPRQVYSGFAEKDTIRTTLPELLTIVFVAVLVYLIFDWFERCIYIYTCVYGHSSVVDMIMSLITKKVPGSYVRKQLNVISYLCLPIAVILRYVLIIVFDYSYDLAQRYVSYCFVISMIFRFIMHIHSLRLLPGIGHFVITTFMMATNLVHFSAVYGSVLFIFSIISYILIDDPVCPVKKADGFGTLIESIFSVFKLTFGHGDLDPFYTNTPVKMAYTLYVIICGLLLMNLIIAIMSTTATNIMTEPWKKILWRIDWLEEALSAEFTFSILGLFCRCCVCGYWSHRKAGYVVHRSTGKCRGSHKVFIEVFHCPALD